MTPTPFSRTRQRGRQDLGGVLVMMVILVLAAFFIYPRVQGDRFAQSERENMALIHANAKEALGAASTAADSPVPLTAGRLDELKAKIFPAPMFLVFDEESQARDKPVRDPHSAWMAPVRLEPWQPATGGSGVSIVYGEVPFHVCLGLLKELPADLVSVDVELLPGAPATLPSEALAQASKAKLKALCLPPKEAGVDAGVQMVFNFPCERGVVSFRWVLPHRAPVGIDG